MPSMKYHREKGDITKAYRESLSILVSKCSVGSLLSESDDAVTARGVSYVVLGI